MSKELDTSWFDLKKYNGLNELDLIGWHRQIQIRSWLLDHGFDKLEFWLDRIKKNPILKNYIPNEGDPKYFFDLVVTPKGKSTVNTTTVMEHWRATNDWYFSNGLSHIGKLCDLSIKGCNITKEQQKQIDTPLSSLYASIGSDNGEDENVTIDLAATDEQITKDFCKWLSEYRKLNNHKFTKNNFTDKDFKEWIQWRLLPYIDLVIISRFEGKQITQAKTANLIYSDASIDTDIVDRLRRTTKPKAMRLFSLVTLEELEAQIKCMALVI